MSSAVIQQTTNCDSFTYFAKGVVTVKVIRVISFYYIVCINVCYSFFPESRETAYIYAISSAGVMYSVTRACAKGELEGCGCDVSVRQKDTKGEFEWGGCSENLRYGSKFSEDFVDSKEQHDQSEFGMMNLWNNAAGRLVSKLK